MANILIVDDHQIYLDGLEMIIQKNLSDSKIYKACDHSSAKSVILQHNNIDLILMDLNLHNQNGLEIWQQLKSEFGPLPLAMLSASEKQQDIKKCKDNGALGFINKAADNNELVSAITQILSGDLFFPYQLPIKASIQLTPRQHEVLTLLAEGLPNKTICRQLEMSEATVKTHLRTLFSLLDVNTRTQCVNVAIKHELI